MAAVNEVLTRVLDALLWPAARFAPVTALVLLSVATAVLVLLVFKWAADQAALSAAKDQVQAAVFEMRLFNDDLAAMFRAQGEVLSSVLRYVRLSLVPTLWLTIPIAVLMLHMDFHFGYTGLAVDAPALVEARFDGSLVPSSGMTSASLDVPDAISLETPGVVLPSAREIVWRIRPRRAGAFIVTVHLGEAAIGKTLVVSDRVVRRSPVRPAAGFLSQVLQPSEPPLPDGTGLAAVTVDYPERPFIVAGWDIGWVGVYLGLTLVFVLLLKRWFGVRM